MFQPVLIFLVNKRITKTFR